MINPVDASLCEAVLDGNIKRVKSIIENHNGNINARNQYGSSIALLAAKRNDFEILRFLADQGADLTVTDKLGQSPIDWARFNKNNEMVDFIEEKSLPENQASTNRI